mmetsp:Transcript_2548/g.10353  ORF Transcript_2548/g.10353 Transcript_2548/m.10353 type:complete len:209 (-) Transcript_2548:598-1224(-)
MESSWWMIPWRSSEHVRSSLCGSVLAVDSFSESSRRDCSLETEMSGALRASSSPALSAKCTRKSPLSRRKYRFIARSLPCRSPSPSTARRSAADACLCAALIRAACVPDPADDAPPPSARRPSPSGGIGGKENSDVEDVLVAAPSVPPSPRLENLPESVAVVVVVVVRDSRMALMYLPVVSAFSARPSPRNAGTSSRSVYLWLQYAAL